jgi:hypothetical protein
LRACRTDRSDVALSALRPHRADRANFTKRAKRANRANFTLRPHRAERADPALRALFTRQADLTHRAGEAHQALDALQAHEATLALQALGSNRPDRAREAASGLARRPGLADDAEANVASVEPADLDVVVRDSVTLGLDPETRSRERAGLALVVVRRPCDAYDHDHQAERAQQRKPSLERHKPFPVAAARQIRAVAMTVGSPRGRDHDADVSDCDSPKSSFHNEFRSRR